VSAPIPTKWSAAGALAPAAAVAAQMACCLPFATSIAGATVAAATSRVAPFQPYLIAASVAFLAYSFYQAYRPDPACTEACEAPAARRAQRIVVWSTAVVVAVMYTAPIWVNWLIYWTL
jgi:mercuric ion transport protein